MSAPEHHTAGHWGSHLAAVLAIRPPLEGNYILATMATDGMLSFEERAANARMMAAALDMRAVCKLVLLFHSASPWDDAKRLEWSNLMVEAGVGMGSGMGEATTRNMCDAARAAIAKAGKGVV